MTTSLVALASNSGLKPSPEASASIEGFLRTWPPSHTTTGTSSTPTWNRSSSACTSVALHLLVGKRLSVSNQELSDAQRVCRMPGADEDQAADAGGEERPPPQDEGAHEDLAELEVPLHESAQMLAIGDDDRSVAESPAADEGAAGGQ